jgi:prepilin-type processing-associated H-X9-DG protein
LNDCTIQPYPNFVAPPYPPYYQLDYLSAQSCQQRSLFRCWSWKGEWVFYGPTFTYTHTQMPNRRSCGQGDWGRWGNMIAASSNHNGGVNVLMGDGTVRFIKNSINYQTWYALATPDGAEVLSAESF